MSDLYGVIFVLISLSGCRSSTTFVTTASTTTSSLISSSSSITRFFLGTYCKEYSSIMPDTININYASMISNMDYNIGKIMILLDELKISNNTLIIFTSDNGPENDVGSAGKYIKGKKDQYWRVE